MYLLLTFNIKFQEKNISINSLNMARWFQITFAITFIFISIFFSDASAKPHLNVLVPNFPPYTFESNNQISGIGIVLANKVFKKAEITVRYRIVPNYAKALYELEQGRGDAVLLASQNNERDELAVFTKPLMINRWCWYLLKNTNFTPYDKSFKKQAKISSHFQANTHKWLIENDYNVEPVMQISNLPQMLLRNRVDAVFIAELAFEEALKLDNLTLNQFKKHIEIEKPFGIYISKTYLTKSPETLKQVNLAIEKVITP